MLFALLNGKRVKASFSLDSGLKYFCDNPLCDSPSLILKRGAIRQPYFSHREKCLCEKISEPESDAHIAMKEFIQSFLEIGDEFVEYAKINGVRPDLFWRSKYAIEVQNSPISIEECQRRNAIYSKNGLIPVWIFHESHYWECLPGDAEPCSSELEGIYGKKYETENDTFRLRTIEQWLVHTCNAVFYLDFRTGVGLREFCMDKLARDRNRDMIEESPLQLRYFHHHFESMADYYQNKPSRRKTLFIEQRTMEISTPLEFLKAIDNTQFNRVMALFSRPREHTDDKILFLQLMRFLGIKPSAEIDFPQFPIWKGQFVILCKHWAEGDDFWMDDLAQFHANKLTPIVIYYLDDQIENFRSDEFVLEHYYGGLLYICANPKQGIDQIDNIKILWYSEYEVEEITTQGRFGEIAEFCRKNWDAKKHFKIFRK